MKFHHDEIHTEGRWLPACLTWCSLLCSDKKIALTAVAARAAVENNLTLTKGRRDNTSSELLFSIFNRELHLFFVPLRYSCLLRCLQCRPRNLNCVSGRLLQAVKIEVRTRQQGINRRNAIV